MNCNHIEKWQDLGMEQPPCNECLEAEIEASRCLYCEETGGKFRPPHKASNRCESGKRDHCTCDICF
jgi:hypothetical protein